MTEEIKNPMGKSCTGTSDRENLCACVCLCVRVWFFNKMNRIIFINSITTEIFTM